MWKRWRISKVESISFEDNNNLYYYLEATVGLSKLNSPVIDWVNTKIHFIQFASFQLFHSKYFGITIDHIRDESGQKDRDPTRISNRFNTFPLGIFTIAYEERPLDDVVSVVVYIDVKCARKRKWVNRWRKVSRFSTHHYGVALQLKWNNIQKIFITKLYEKSPN